MTVQLDLEEDFVALLGESDHPVPEAARELIILELYRQGKISGGRASESLGMPRLDFIQYTGKLGIPYFSMTPDEMEEEIARIADL